jgi:hypothetical protein
MVVVAAAFLSGCTGAMVGFQPSVFTAGPGFIVTDVQGGSLIVDNRASMTKTGKSCSSEVLGLVATGDTRVETAMLQGGITKVAHVQQSLRSYVFGIYAEVCTIVRGE